MISTLRDFYLLPLFTGLFTPLTFHVQKVGSTFFTFTMSYTDLHYGSIVLVLSVFVQSGCKGLGPVVHLQTSGLDLSLIRALLTPDFKFFLLETYHSISSMV